MTDSSVFAQIERLTAEEHALFERASRDEAEHKRLAALQLELDQCWDLLRQRRALREFGEDPAQAKLRPPEVVKRYTG